MRSARGTPGWSCAGAYPVLCWLLVHQTWVRTCPWVLAGKWLARQPHAPGLAAHESVAEHPSHSPTNSPLLLFPPTSAHRMRNARGMTPLNVALLCQHRNLASLLTAGSTIPPPLPPLRRSATGQQALPPLPPLLRQQLLSLVHRAALLGELRQLGLGSGAEGQPPPGLAPTAVARLETLLRSDRATAQQVLAVVDELLDEATATGTAGAAGAAGEAASSASGAAPASGQRSRRRARRRQEEREAAAQQLAAAQAGVDWTLLERNRASLWHAEHGPSAFQRRLQRRRDAQRAAAQAPAAVPAQTRAAEAAALAAAAAAELPGAGGAEREDGPAPGSSEHALLLAGALLQQAEEEPLAQQAQQAAQQSLQHGPSTASGSQGPSSPSNASATAGTAEHPDDEALAAATAAEVAAAAEAAGCGAGSAAGSQAEGALCPICLDLPADICIAPCSHRACLACCGKLVSYCASSSFGLPLAPPLCPLCRGSIETFRKTA